MIISFVNNFNDKYKDSLIKISEKLIFKIISLKMVFWNFSLSYHP